MHTVNKFVAKGLLAKKTGRFVSITAIKKDGTITFQNGQIVNNPPTLDSDKFITIRRSKSKAFKAISLDRITRIAVDGIQINVI
jgi:hypothetical protein